MSLAHSKVCVWSLVEGATFVAAHSKVWDRLRTEWTGNLVRNVLALSYILLKMGNIVFKFVQNLALIFVQGGEMYLIFGKVLTFIGEKV